MYTTLQRLDSKRLVSTTPAGKEAVRATTAAIEAMVGDLGELMGEA